MFDPTAFDNMKVVIEGALYDLDLNGDIAIIDRNDIINTAKMLRKFEVTFSTHHAKNPLCTFVMQSNLENLAAELLPTHQSERLAGSHIQITYSTLVKSNFLAYGEVLDTIIKVWGRNRRIEQKVSFNPIDEGSKTIETTILFDRLVLEDQIDDLIEMVDYMVKTLNLLNE